MAETGVLIKNDFVRNDRGESLTLSDLKESDVLKFA
jgi:hypothetical protein